MFTKTEIRTIERLLSVATDERIAIILGKPVNEVRKEIDNLCNIDVSGRRRNRYDVKKVKTKTIPYRKQLTEEDRLQRTQERDDQRERRRVEKEQVAEERKRIATLNKNANNAFSKKKITATRIKQDIRQNRKMEPVLKSKEVNYSDKKLVRVNNKTFIYVNAGEDVEAAKQKFLSVYKK